MFLRISSANSHDHFHIDMIINLFSVIYDNATRLIVINHPYHSCLSFFLLIMSVNNTGIINKK